MLENKATLYSNRRDQPALARLLVFRPIALDCHDLICRMDGKRKERWIHLGRGIASKTSEPERPKTTTSNLGYVVDFINKSKVSFRTTVLPTVVIPT